MFFVDFLKRHNFFEVLPFFVESAHFIQVFFLFYKEYKRKLGNYDNEMLQIN